MGLAQSPAIVFALSDKTQSYWVYTAVAISSLLQNTRLRPRLFVLHDGTLGLKAKAFLQEIVHRNRATIKFLTVGLPESLRSIDLGHYTLASIYRLLIPQIFHSEPYVMYFDSDVVFNGFDICMIIEQVKDEGGLWAVRDPFIGEAKAHLAQLESHGLNARNYFNSGVMVFRPKRIKIDLLNNFVDWWQVAPLTSHPDQDFLNLQFQDQWHQMDEEANFQVTIFNRRLFLNLDSYWGKVLHFAGKIKPVGNLAPGLIPWYVNMGLTPGLQQELTKMSLHYLQEIRDVSHAVRRIRIEVARGI
jgi:lipopolysaccharide biosynthesis glycosyltransferase